MDRIKTPPALDYSRQFPALLEFATGARVDNGFGYLGPDGQVVPDRPAELWITCRMTHVFALADLLGYPRARELAEHGVRSLRGAFHDDEFGGWYSAVALTGNQVVDESKAAYAHAFVILAATSALAAEIEGAGDLLAEALDNQDRYWFEPEVGRVRESWNREFTRTEDYRGINANMHTTEAYLAAADLTGDEQLLRRAVGILHFVAQQAEAHRWRIPEHFTADWQVLPEYNEDQPAHPFRPFGVTPGHGFEWSRLMLQARQSLVARGEEPPAWMLQGAQELFRRADADSWQVDGEPGFIYTTDFDGHPVVRERMHWVLCEAVGANIVLQRVLGDNPELADQLQTWGEYADQFLLEAPGRWWHELDPSNHPAERTWPGKPDAYHVAQMLILPLLPASPAFAAALKRGNIAPIGD
ncbi:AGE family epimerase/isomerase [Actinomyces sp. F1_1611]